MTLKIDGTNGLDFGTGKITQPVGAVSQAAGIPTGAIVESGTNTNGNYVMYADGTLINYVAMTPTSKAITTGYGSLFYWGNSWTFPKPFLPGTIPAVSGGFSAGGGGLLLMGFGGTTNTLSTYYILNATSFTATIGETLIAIGRWY